MRKKKSHPSEEWYFNYSYGGERFSRGFIKVCTRRRNDDDDDGHGSTQMSPVTWAVGDSISRAATPLKGTGWGGGATTLDGSERVRVGRRRKRHVLEWVVGNGSRRG